MEQVKQDQILAQGEIIKQYITETILYDQPGIELTDAFPLLEQTMMDSLQFLNLVLFIQERFQITIRPIEMVPENFESIQAMVALIDRLRKE
jgi:acyl carrier protein